MSHTEQELPADALKRHFANRLTNQIRVVLNRWRTLHEHPLSSQNISDLLHEIDSLKRRAQRFEADSLLKQTEHIQQQLQSLLQKDEGTHAKTIEDLHENIYQLGQFSLRRDDRDHNVDQHIPNKKPVFLAVSKELSDKLIEQLNHFDIQSHTVLNQAHLNKPQVF